MEGCFGFSRNVGRFFLAIASVPAWFIFGGHTVQIARFAESGSVPFMAAAYVLMALVEWSMHITLRCPAYLTMIIKSAFGLGGSRKGEPQALFTASQCPIVSKAGLFSRRPAMGSAPERGSDRQPPGAAITLPRKPGAAMGVFIDHHRQICTATAVNNFSSPGVLEPGSGITGQTQLTQQAMESPICGGSLVIYFNRQSPFYFWLSTRFVANYSYAENAMTFPRSRQHRRTDGLLRHAALGYGGVGGRCRPWQTCSMLQEMRHGADGNHQPLIRHCAALWHGSGS